MTPQLRIRRGVGIVQKHAVLPGTSPNYFSSSNAGEITSDWTIVAKFTAPDYTPAAEIGIAGQYQLVGNLRNFLASIQTGAAATRTSSDGTLEGEVDSSTALTDTDNVETTLRWRYDLDDGGGNRAAYFDRWTGSWTAIGTSPVTAVGTVASVFNSSAVVMIGGILNGATLLLAWAGNVKRIQAFNSLNSAGTPFGGATLLWDFNPNDYVSGTSWTSSTTGETWDIIGTASVVND
jgi:hypothetical protein